MSHSHRVTTPRLGWGRFCNPLQPATFFGAVINSAAEVRITPQTLADIRTLKPGGVRQDTKPLSYIERLNYSGLIYIDR